MISRKLYIIGNGFDLWHGIPSSYGKFKEFVLANDRDVFEDVEEYLPAGDMWGDLEAALADIDIDQVVDNLGHYMVSYGADDWSDSGHHDFPYEVEQVVTRLSKKLRVLFGKWIRQLAIPTAASAPRRLRSLDPSGTFLTFNYTATLRETYDVPDAHVLHIHGRADQPQSELVLGHAWNPKSRRSLNDRSDVEDIDTRLMQAHDILDDYFSQTFKPTGRLIQEHRDFFESLRDTKEVTVLGHSLADVDAAYFKAILAVSGLSAATWTLACLDDHEEKSNRLQALGVNAAYIKTVIWDNL
ncbi:hypothetical protein GO285_01247 [Ralstonia solanacearum]|nr:hypothetical protein [Ralstonia solanacearum]NKF94159.1 hypothetical protein [Ralstonia solanacearum]NKG09531.1 hypothetical protein [Ralstonia solanacearum]